MIGIKIPLDWPNLGELEKEYVVKAIESGYVSTSGPLVKKFEEEFANCVGAKYAVATANGTMALHLALMLLSIGPGDEVIVPALTFIASVNPVIYVGATPVVVDVDPVTWNIDPEAIKKAVTPRTKAIIPVHLYGNPANMIEIIKIARKYNLHVIEDASEALGSKLNGKYMGTFGDIGVFSFNGNKIITTGGGGMLVTDDELIARKARLIVNQGRESGIIEYEHIEIGYNYRLTNLQAALGLAQLKRLPEFLSAKVKNAEIYKQELNDIPGITWQQEIPEASSNWWLFSVILDEKYKSRIEIINDLKCDGIQTRPLFKPIYMQPCYKGFSFPLCPIAFKLYSRGINLPSATFLTEKDIKYTCHCLKRVIL
ncbi:LegC family aminotransferase [Thermoanaerobacterium sp. DL9XJH110]|uniref:LegC family aminotransferase n=1 Tax=Thermoanaerobacterium sp. DL9XJH110 TaxID=3386643 RepID=UPI003BB591F8